MNEANLADKKKSKKFFMILLIIFLILLFVSAAYFMNKRELVKNQQIVVLENPMKGIVQRSVNNDEPSNIEKIIEQGIKEFNENYISYILLSLGVNNLHSFPGFGNPIVELALDNEVWSSEIINGGLITIKALNENKDLRFVLSKEEAVKALLSQNIEQFMKDSVVSGRTRIEMIAVKPELLAKGYLDLYNALNS